MDHAEWGADILHGFAVSDRDKGLQGLREDKGQGQGDHQSHQESAQETERSEEEDGSDGCPFAFESLTPHPLKSLPDGGTKALSMAPWRLVDRARGKKNESEAFPFLHSLLTEIGIV